MSDWDDESRLDERRASASEVPRHRSRKNTRRWCRGKIGVDHVLDVRLDRYGEMLWRRDKAPCYRPSWRPASWWCNHERYCTRCGKILDASLNDECSNYTIEVN